MKARRILTIVVMALAVSMISPLVEASPASAAVPGDFVGLINGLRASHGLGALSVDGGLSSVAQGWANHMASAGSISHNGGLSGQVGGGWTKLGENVGVGGDVNQIFTALVNSPGHYANMVDGGFNHIGVGVAVGSDGRIYTTHDFAAYPGGGGGGGNSSSSAPRSSGSSSSAPRTTSTSTAAHKATTSAKAPGSPAAAPAPPTTTAPPAPPAPPASQPPTPAATPALPGADGRIVAGLVEVGSITTQG